MEQCRKSPQRAAGNGIDRCQVEGKGRMNRAVDNSPNPIHQIDNQYLPADPGELPHTRTHLCRNEDQGRPVVGAYDIVQLNFASKETSFGKSGLLDLLVHIFCPFYSLAPDKIPSVASYRKLCADHIR